MQNTIFSQFPDVGAGYELNPEYGYFTVVIPEETTNLVINPSVEINATGYTAVNGTAARSIATADISAYGLAGLLITPNASAEAGFYYGNVTVTASTTYTFSITLQGEENKIYYLWFGTTAGALLGTKRPYIGTGKRERIWVTYNNTTEVAVRVYLTRDSRYTDTNPFYADGLQVEAKAYPTTYCDGSLKGFVIGDKSYWWNGPEHASTSYRMGNTRTGGREINLHDLGLHILSVQGLGMSTVVDQTLPVSGIGEFAQGSGTQAREFILVSALLSATSNPRRLQELRSDLIDVFKPDLVASPQPIILRYYPRDEYGDVIGESLDITCKYISGLEGSWDNHQQERLALRFKMHYPWIESTFDNKALVNRESTTIERIIMRTRGKTWAMMGASLGAVNDWVRAITSGPDGTIYIGGDFTNLVDANGDYISRWNGSVFSSMGTGANGNVHALAYHPTVGSLYAGGAFTLMGGVANTVRIAEWDGANWTALGTGIPDGMVSALEYDRSVNLYAGGSFTSAGGAADTARIAKWIDGVGWSTVGTEITNGQVYVIRVRYVSPTTYDIYVGGSFTNVGSANGDAIVVMRAGDTTWTALDRGAASTVYAIEFGPDGFLYAGGAFSNTSLVTNTSCIARWNGTQWEALGTGITGEVRSMYFDEKGLLHVAGLITVAGGVTIPNNAAVWNGSVWVPEDIGTSSASILDSHYTVDGRAFYGGSGNFLILDQPTYAWSNGTMASRPIIKAYGFEGTGIYNYTSEQALYFDQNKAVAGEYVALDLRLGKFAFEGSVSGNLLGMLYPGSNMNFHILPGANYLATLIASSYGISFVWKDAYWSIDGAVFR